MKCYKITFSNNFLFWNCFYCYFNSWVISESDLLDALNSGQVAFAGLDVFEKEPPENTAILKHQNLSMSPHIGGSTKEAQNRIGLELAEKVIEYFRK